jgi:hypothetical protein
MWGKWKQTEEWRRGFVQHVSTWLNERRFEQEPELRAAPAPMPIPLANPAHETFQQRLAREQRERDRIASRRETDAVDRKLAELRRYYPAATAHGRAS